MSLGGENSFWNPYTRIVLFAVVVIVGCMLIFPPIENALRNARQTRDTGITNQIRAALATYAGQHNGIFPASKQDFVEYVTDKRAVLTITSPDFIYTPPSKPMQEVPPGTVLFTYHGIAYTVDSATRLEKQKP